MKCAFVGLVAILGNQCCMDPGIVCGRSVRIVAKYSALHRFAPFPHLRIRLLKTWRAQNGEVAPDLRKLCRREWLL